MASIQWKKQTFEALEKLYTQCGENGASTPEQQAMVARYGDIQNMMVPDRIMPPTQSVGRRRLEAALREVLSRLPETVFDQVESEVQFVFEDPALKPLAINANAPTGPDGKRAVDTIVFFHMCAEFPPDALIGLVAHEIAHTFAGAGQYAQDEAAADAQVRQWGFTDELKSLRHITEHRQS